MYIIYDLNVLVSKIVQSYMKVSDCLILECVYNVCVCLKDFSFLHNVYP